MVWYGAYRNMSFLAHWHDEIELIRVRSGSACIHIADQTYEAEKGDLILCCGGNIHYCDSYDRENLLEFIVFTPHLVTALSDLPDIRHPHIKNRQLEAAGLLELTEGLFRRVPEELRAKDSHYQEIVKSKLYEFWYTVKRAFPNETATSIVSHRQTMTQKFQQLLTFIDTHYQDPLYLEDAARLLHFNASYFSRLFHQYTGMNFTAYLNTVRIEEAISRLYDSSDRIVDIAFECGFNSIRTFNRVFRQMTSCSPSAFCRQKGSVPPLLYTFRLRKGVNASVVENDSFVVIQDGKVPAIEGGRRPSAGLHA